MSALLKYVFFRNLAFTFLAVIQCNRDSPAALNKPYRWSSLQRFLFACSVIVINDRVRLGQQTIATQLNSHSLAAKRLTRHGVTFRLSVSIKLVWKQNWWLKAFSLGGDLRLIWDQKRWTIKWSLVGQTTRLLTLEVWWAGLPADSSLSFEVFSLFSSLLRVGIYRSCMTEVYRMTAGAYLIIGISVQQVQIKQFWYIAKYQSVSRTTS